MGIQTNNIPAKARETAPVLLRRTRAAAFLDMSSVHFDKMVRDGKLPPPRRVDDNIRAWAVADLEAAVEAMPYVTDAA